MYRFHFSRLMSAVICWALVACQAQSATSTSSPIALPPSPAAASTLAAISLSPTVSPTPAPLEFSKLVQQFDYDSSAPLNIQDLGKSDIDRLKIDLPEGVTLSQISYDAPGGVLRAYLIAPGGNGPFAGVLWLHKYPGDNTEFLEEAATLGSRGVVSLLIEGRYPWQSQPGTFDADRESIVNQILDLRRGLDLLAARDDVDLDRIAFVGHDYGAMHGAVLAGLDHRLKAYVLMAPTGSYTDWRTYFGPLKLADLREYLHSSPSIDPLTYVMHAAPAMLFFQFAEQDKFVSQEKANALAAAASDPKQVKMYDASHELDETARIDRDGFLVSILSLK